MKKRFDGRGHVTGFLLEFAGRGLKGWFGGFKGARRQFEEFAGGGNSEIVDHDDAVVVYGNDNHGAGVDDDVAMDDSAVVVGVGAAFDVENFRGKQCFACSRVCTPVFV